MTATGTLMKNTDRQLQPNRFRLGQKATENQSDRRRKPQHRSVDPERLASFSAGKDFPERGQDLRGHGSSGDALHDARRDQFWCRCREPCEQARRAEQPGTSQEDALAP
jgi:hypothetical protein